MQQTNKIPNFNCCFSKESDDNACSLSTSCETLIFGRFNGDKNSVCACVDFVYYFYESSYVFISNSWNIRIDISCQIDRHLLCQLNNDRKELTFFSPVGEQHYHEPFFKSRIRRHRKGGIRVWRLLKIFDLNLYNVEFFGEERRE